MEVVADAGALAARAAEMIADRMPGCAAPFRLVLSGGSTPRGTYQPSGAAGSCAWDCAEIFFGDERFVPPDHPDSNYRMVARDPAGRPQVNPRGLFAIPTDGTPQSAADAL